MFPWIMNFMGNQPLQIKIDPPTAFTWRLVLMSAFACTPSCFRWWDPARQIDAPLSGNILSTFDGPAVVLDFVVGVRFADISCTELLIADTEQNLLVDSSYSTCAMIAAAFSGLFLLSLSFFLLFWFLKKQNSAKCPFLSHSKHVTLLAGHSSSLCHFGDPHLVHPGRGLTSGGFLLFVRTIFGNFGPKNEGVEVNAKFR